MRAKLLRVVVAVALGAALLTVAGVSEEPAAAADVPLATGYSGVINDAVFDSARGVVYASVPSADATHANEVIAFDPATGAVQWSVFAGSEPDHLALATDGSLLHVGLGGANSVARIDLTSRLVTTSFGLGSGTSGPYDLIDMVPLPGAADTVVVAVGNGSTPRAVKVFDAGVERSDIVSTTYGATALLVVDATTVYGYEGATTGFGYTTFAVDVDGITDTSTVSTALSGFRLALTFDSGRIYASSGHIIETDGTLVATLPTRSSAGPVVRGGTVWMTDDSHAVLTGYSTTTFAQLGAPLALDLAGGSVRGMIDTSAGLLVWTDRGTGSPSSIQPSAEPQALVLNDALPNASRSVIYGTVGATSSQYANSVVALNSSSLAVEWSVWVGSEPDVLALSDDGSKLFVGLLGGGGVARVDVSTRTVDLDFSLGLGSHGALYANDIEVLPGTTDTVVVSRKAKGVSPNHEGVAVFDLDVMRPSVTPGHTGSNVIELASAGTGYGFNNSGSGFYFYTLQIDAGGISRVGTATTAIRGFDSDIALSGGLVYGSNGAVIDPTTGATEGSFAATSDIRPDVYGGSVHLVDYDEIRSFNPSTFARTDTQTVGEPSGSIYGVITTATGFFVHTADGFGYAEEPAPTPTTPPGTVAGGGFIRGWVTDEVTGLPIHTLCVVIVDEDDTFVAVTDSNGEFSMVLDEGTYYIAFAECEYYEYFAEWYDDRLPADILLADPVVIVAGEETQIRAALTPLFDDVERGSTFFEDIVWLRGAGITTGCSSTSYCPSDTVTREQMAAFIARTWRLFGGSCTPSGMPFGDVARSSFAYDDIACIYDLGITTGTTPSTYSPGNPVTRQEMGAFLARLWVAMGNTCTVDSMPFVDVPSTSFARPAIACIFELGITTGTSATTYSPYDPVTREQMAAFIARLGRLLEA